MYSSYEERLNVEAMKLSKAEKLSAKEAKKFLTKHNRLKNPPPCEYGHYDCSTEESGACLNEVLGLHPEYDEDRAIEEGLI